MTSTYVTVTETAKLVRKALKEAFPGVRFSVRSNSYSGGASVSIGWTDGPNEAQVNAVAKCFQGSYTDGSIDYKGAVFHMLNGKEVHFGADFILTRRDDSDEAVQRAIDRACRTHSNALRQLGLSAPSVEDYRKGKLGLVYLPSTGDSLGSEIRRIIFKNSDRLSAKMSATASSVFVTRDDGYSRSVGCGISAVDHESL